MSFWFQVDHMGLIGLDFYLEQTTTFLEAFQYKDKTLIKMDEVWFFKIRESILISQTLVVVIYLLFFYFFFFYNNPASSYTLEV